MQDSDNVETLANRFKYAAERLLGLPDDAEKGRLIACQTYQALLSVTDYPREELSDATLMYAFAAGVSDAICRLTKQEDLEDLTEEFVDAIRYGNRYKMTNGFCSETFLPRLSIADEKSMSTCIAERLEKRIRFDEWRTGIFNDDESLSFEEFDRRAQSDPKPTDPLEPFWQMKRNCKEVISGFGATDRITAAAELLRTIEREQPEGTAQVENGEGSHE